MLLNTGNKDNEVDDEDNSDEDEDNDHDEIRLSVLGVKKPQKRGG